MSGESDPGTGERERGERVRAEVLGPGYGATHDGPAGEITAAFEDLALRFAWASTWGRPELDRRTRSAATIATLVALGRPVELGLHLRAGVRNGLRVAELGELLLHSAVYCGMPAVNAAMREVRPILEELARDERGAAAEGER